MKNQKNKIDLTPSVRKQIAESKSSIQQVNNYGTYEIQPTANTENQYPAIAQGFNKKIIENDCENKDAENSR